MKTGALPRQAQNAFLVYASEFRHPVEVFANEEVHLATWLGKRLAIQNLKVPDLQPLGFYLVRPAVARRWKAGAMFMYEDQNGERLTVLVGRNTKNRSKSFRFASSDNLDTFYWIDGELGYAVTGEISRDLLRQVAENATGSSEPDQFTPITLTPPVRGISCMQSQGYREAVPTPEEWAPPSRIFMLVATMSSLGSRMASARRAERGAVP